MNAEDGEPTTGDGLLAGGADAAIWACTDRATRRATQEVVETLRARATVQQLAERYANYANPQRAGHLFEVMHAVAFNRAAARVGSPVRAKVTEFVAGGSQTAPADITLVDGGRLVGQAQVKLIDSIPRTAHDLADPKYTGMRRVVAADKLQAVDDLLERRLQMSPQGVRFENYADERSHLSDHLRHGPAHSSGISQRHAHHAAEHPVRWANGQVTAAAGREVIVATATGAAAGAVVAGILSAAGVAARARADETPAGVAALTVAGSATRAAARSGALAGLATAVRLAAEAGLMPAAFGGGTLPSAVATAVTEVARAGLDLANGHIEPGAFAAASATATTNASLVWACGVVGLTVLPVPVIGTLAGGIAGQTAATMITHGLQLAIIAARADRAEERRVALLEREAMTTVATTAALRDAVQALADQHNAFVTETVLPQLAQLNATLTTPNPTDALGQLAELAQNFGGQPIFTAMPEFDQWMADQNTSLTLNPNPQTNHDALPPR